jgi:hypothetical protein
VKFACNDQLLHIIGIEKMKCSLFIQPTEKHFLQMSVYYLIKVVYDKTLKKVLHLRKITAEFLIVPCYEGLLKAE